MKSEKSAPEGVWAELKAKVRNLKSLGEYGEACRQFAENIKGLPGVRAVSAKYCGDYVDLWVFTDETNQIGLIRPVGKALWQVSERFPQLSFDSFVTRQGIPPDFVVLFESS